MIEINSISGITKNITQFKKDGHKVTPHFLINLKSKFERNKKHGFTIRYKSGYFFWVARVGNFEMKMESI